MQTFIFEGKFVSEQPLATCSKDLKDAHSFQFQTGKNAPIPVPFMKTAEGTKLYFPATGIRGGLRRACRDLVRDHIIAATGDEKPFSLDVHYMLTLGGIKGAEKENQLSVLEEEHWRKVNPLLSMFGAGMAGHLGFVSGHLHVGNAITDNPCDPVVFSGARANDLYRDKSQIKYLSDEDIESLVERSKGNSQRSSLNAELQTAKKELNKLKRGKDMAALEAAEEKVSRLDAQIKSVKENTGAGDVSVGMPLPGYQAIPQGEVMSHVMRLVRSNHVELGCLLATLGRFALDPLLGAHKATGCGMVSGEWEVFEVEETGKRSMGKVVMEPYQPLQLSDELKAKVAVFNEFLASGEWDFSIPEAGKAKD
jgi:hypothetical protein